MERIKRIGVSLEPDLLEQLDEFVKSRGYPSRSEAIRDMVRNGLSSERLQDPMEPSVGSLMILYGHHERGLSNKLTDFQHAHHNLIISTTHIHLDKDLCLEILVCRGKAGEIKSLADRLSAIRGVRYGQVFLRSIGESKKKAGSRSRPR